MVPEFEDPTTLKFVNGKFVLATNDPKNPVQLIRQLHKNDTSKVVIYLANGISYEDSIDSLEDLIDISGNKAFEVVLNFEISISVYDTASVETIEKLFSKFLNFNCMLKHDFYLQTSKMIPHRITPISMESQLVFSERDGEFRPGSGEISISYLVISPPQFIEEIISYENGVEKTIESLIRRRVCEVGGIGVSGRNSTGSSITKANISEAIVEMKSHNVEYTLTVSNRSNNSEVSVSKIEDIKKVVSFFRP